MVLSRRQALWLIPAAFAVHNAEEALTFPQYLPLMSLRLPSSLRAIAGEIEPAGLRIALLGVTIVGLAVVFWADRRPDSQAARWSALVLQGVVAINVISHVAIAMFLLRGYSPGLISAVLINAPLSVYLFRRAAQEGWMSRRSWRAIWPAALLIHGPGLFGILLLARRLAGS